MIIRRPDIPNHYKALQPVGGTTGTHAVLFCDFSFDGLPVSRLPGSYTWYACLGPVPVPSRHTVTCSARSPKRWVTFTS